MLETRQIPKGGAGPLETEGLLVPRLPFWHRMEPFSAEKRRNVRVTAGDAKKGARWGPKPHVQHKCLAPACEEKPALGGRF